MLNQQRNQPGTVNLRLKKLCFKKLGVEKLFLFPHTDFFLANSQESDQIAKLERGKKEDLVFCASFSRISLSPFAEFLCLTLYFSLSLSIIWPCCNLAATPIFCCLLMHTSTRRKICLWPPLCNFIPLFFLLSLSFFIRTAGRIYRGEKKLVLLFS